MHFLIDENLPFDFVVLAKQFKHEALWVRTISPGEPDSEIVKRLCISKEILVTRDIGFANHVFRLIAKGESLSGVILIREQNLNVMNTAWLNFLNQPINCQGIVVLSETRIRVRNP